jgi:hypothetical protein
MVGRTILYMQENNDFVIELYTQYLFGPKEYCRDPASRLKRGIYENIKWYGFVQCAKTNQAAAFLQFS